MIDDLVSPFDDAHRETVLLAPRLESLAEKRITLLSISKPKSAEFLDTLESILRDEYRAEVVRSQKPTFTAPAPADVWDCVARSSDAVVEALAD